MAFGDLAAAIKKVLNNGSGTTAQSITNPESTDIEILEIRAVTELTGSYVVFVYDDNAGAAGDLIGVLVIEAATYRDAFRPAGLKVTATTGKIWFKMSSTLASGQVNIITSYHKLA